MPLNYISDECWSASDIQKNTCEGGWGRMHIQHTGNKPWLCIEYKGVKGCLTPRLVVFRCNFGEIYRDPDA